MTETAGRYLTKVPEVTIVFWIIKIAATTLGETGGDSVTMTLNWGYLIGTAIFLSLFGRTRHLADRGRGSSIRCSTGRRSSPPRPSAPPWPILPTARSASAMPAARPCCFGCLIAVLAVWYWSLGSISVDDRRARRRSRCSTGLAITFSQTLGTALGDWTAADTGGLGYDGGALVFAAGLAVLAALYFWTSDFARVPVLGGLHPDAAARRHGRRFSRQAA